MSSNYDCESEIDLCSNSESEGDYCDCSDCCYESDNSSDNSNNEEISSKKKRKDQLININELEKRRESLKDLLNNTLKDLENLDNEISNNLFEYVNMGICEKIYHGQLNTN